MMVCLFIAGAALFVLLARIVVWFVRAFQNHSYSMKLKENWRRQESESSHDGVYFQTKVSIKNNSSQREYIVSSLTATANVVAKDEHRSSYSPSREIAARIVPPDGRTDGYWPVWVIEPGKELEVSLVVGPFADEDIEKCAAVWARVRAEAHGPHGIEAELHDTIFSPERLLSPDDLLESPACDPSWRDVKEAGKVLPIRTHMLTECDDICDIINKYVKPYASAGDIVAIAESPVAIMQGRYVHPDKVKPGWLAHLGCILVPSKTSFGRPHGMQVLIDLIGSLRFVKAMLIGQIAERLKIRGAFYRACGPDSTLVDDISGTLPPYDSFIVLGPTETEKTVAVIKRRCGLDAAIVDVSYCTRNNTILAHTDGTTQEELLSLLAPNPAGNDNEGTPIVLLRPSRCLQVLPLKSRTADLLKLPSVIDTIA